MIKNLKVELIKKMVPRGFRGWCVEYKDGSEINESQMEWNSVPKVGIIRLSLHFDGRQWDLVRKENYFQKKNASTIPGIPDSFRIESRSIGYYDGDCKVLYTVNENTGKMKMEIIDTK